MEWGYHPPRIRVAAQEGAERTGALRPDRSEQAGEVSSAPNLEHPSFGVDRPPRGASHPRRVCLGELSRGLGPAPAPEQRVEAVVAASLGRDEQEDEAEQDGGYPLVLQGPGAVPRLELPVRDRHLAGEDEGDRPGEEAEQYRDAAKEFENAADPDLGHQGRRARLARHSAKPSEQDHGPGLKE